MALKQRDVSLNYLRIKEGKFWVGKDSTTGYTELEGKIVGIRYKNEEYEGIPQRKCLITLQDGDEKYQLNLNVESSSYSALVSFLKNVDVSQTLTLHPKEDVTVKDGKEVARRTILVSQDGTFAKNYFTKENKHGLPEWNIVLVGKKKVVDKSEYLDFLENFVETNLVPNIAREDNTPIAPKPSVDVAKNAKPIATEDVLDTTDLPWDL